MNVPGLISATEVENILSGRKPYAPQLPADQMPVEAEPAVAEREFAKVNSLVPPVTSTLSRVFADSFKYGVFPTVAPLYGMADRALRSAGTVTQERGQQLQQERVAEAQQDVTAAEGMADNRRQFIEETAKRAGADMAALEKRFGKEAIQSGTAPAQKRVEQEKQNVPTQEWWLNALDEFRKATGSTAISTIEAPAVVADLVQEALTGDTEKNPVREYLQAYERDVLLKTYPGDKARAKDFLTTLSAGAGSMTAFVVGGAATRALGMSAKVGSATIGGASQATMQVRDAEDFGATTAQKWLALMGGIGLGATEALPIDRMFRRLDIATGGGVANALKRTTAASLEEFTQELVQGVGQDVVAKYLAYYDPNREMDIASYVRQGLAGAIIGGGTALIMEGASGAERAEAIRMQQEAQKRSIESQSGVSGPEVAPTPEERSAAFSEAQARLNEITGEETNVEIGPVGRDGAEGTAGDVGVQPQPAQPDVADPDGAAPVTESDRIDATSRQNTVTLEALGNGLIRDASFLRDLSKAEPFTKLGLGGFDIPSRRIVAARVFSVIKNPQVRDAVIKLIPVDVVDILSRQQLSPDVLLNDMPMLSNLFAADGNNSIPFTVDEAIRISASIADVTAKYVSAAADLAGTADNANATGGAASGDAAGLGGQVAGMAAKGTPSDGRFTSGKDAAASSASVSGQGSVPEMFSVTYNSETGLATLSTFDPNDPAIDAMAVNRASGPFKAEPMRPQQGIADMGQAQDAEDIALSAMKSSLTKLLDLTVRQGRLTAGRGALGQYNQKTGVIRMKTWGDYSVLVHEAGHALNDHKGAALDQIINQHAAELRDAAIKLYPGDAAALPRTKQVREGFAEFFRLYMTNQQAAQNVAPNFFASFERTLVANAPEMAEGLNLIRQQFEAWLAIPSTRAVQSFIVSGRKPTLMDEARAGVQENGLIGWMKRGMSAFGYKSYLNGIDQMHALRKAVFELSNIAEENLGAPFGLEASQNPHILAVLGANSQNAAMVQLKNGVRRYQSSEVVAPALRDAIVVAMGQNPENNTATFDEQRMADFNAYLVARRARAEYQRFRNGELMKPPVAFSEGDALQAIADFEAKYGNAFMQAAQMVYDINRAMMQRAYDAGMVDAEVFDLAMQKEDYVPLMRDMSDTGTAYGESVLTTGKASIVKRFRGSDRDIIAPLDSIMNRAFALEKTIARNDVRKALGRLANVAGAGGGKIVEKLKPQEVKAMRVPVLETMRKVLDSPEIDPVDAAEMATIFEAAFDKRASVDIFKSQLTSEKGEPILFYWEGGEQQAIRLGDNDLAQDLYNALAVVGHENLPLLSDVLTMPAAMIRTGVTAWPDFQVVNFIRDQVSAYFLSGTNFIPFVSGVRGSLNEVRNRKVAQDYNAAMGIMGGMNVASVDIARGQRDIDALRKRGYRGEIAGDGTIAGAVKGLGRFVELTETGTRLGIFEAAYNRAASEGLSEADALYEAAFLATDYMNYGSRGSRMLLATRAVPFLNASLRGLDKLVRTAFGGEAAGRRGVKFALTSYFKQINNLPISRREKMALQTGRALWLKMSALAMISAALTSAFKDDEDYQEASPYLRATGWVIPYGNGNILWIPKPFELAIISNFMERAIEMANGDDRAMERFRDGVMMTAVPPFESPTIKLAYELANNVNTFRGGPLVPDYMLRLPPELQYHARTSELAKRMGEATGVSPIKIEHTITSLFASAGRDVLPLLDRPLNPDRAEKGIDETMVTRRFWRSVDRGSVSSQDFYQMMSRKNGELTQAAAGYSKAVDSGNELAANDYLSHLKPDEKAWAILNHHYAAKYKRLHPGYRANQVSSTVSSMRREIVSSRLKDTSDTGGTIPLTAKQRRLVDDVLADIQRREMRNALVVMEVPGWKGKNRMDVTRSIDMLRATNPFVAEELERRMAKAKVYNADTVAQNWPDLKQRLIADRGEAILDDLLAISQ